MERGSFPVLRDPTSSPTPHLSAVGTLPLKAVGPPGARGLGRGVAVCTCPDTEPLVSCSGIVTGIYTTSTPEACQYIAYDCRANVIVVDTQKQLEKILQVWGKGTVAWGLRLGVLMNLQLAEDFPPSPSPPPCRVPLPSAATPMHSHRARQGSGYLPIYQVRKLRPTKSKGQDPLHPRSG